MTETAMGTRVPREKPGESQEEDKPAEGEVEETEKGYEEAKKKTENEEEMKNEEKWASDGWVSNWKRETNNMGHGQRRKFRPNTRETAKKD